MGKLSRAPRAVTGSGPRERMLERVGRWVRPVVLLLSLGAGAFWALELWTVWSWFGIVWAAGVTIAVVRALIVVSDSGRMLRVGQVIVLGGILVGVALGGALQHWFLGAGAFDPSSVRFDENFTSTLPASDPPRPLSTVHATWVLAIVVLGPLLRLTLRLLRPHAARLDAIDAARDATAAEEAERLREANRLGRASARGRMTGFEPSALADVELRPSDRVHGEPGLGLTAMRGQAARIAKGLEGERNLAKALQLRGLLDRFPTFWSLQMPSDGLGAHERNRGDIDCVVVTGRRIYVLDTKALWQADVTRYTEGNLLFVRDNPTGYDIGDPLELDSAHLRLATDALHRQLHAIGAKQQVVAAVVLMPDDHGLGYADGAFWPGGIPAWDLLQLLEQLEQEPPFDERSRHSEHVLRTLRALVKDASGAAPTRRSIARDRSARLAAERRAAQQQAAEQRAAGRGAAEQRRAEAAHQQSQRPAPPRTRPAEPSKPFGPDDDLADRLPF